jgi:hypothetical protein
MNQDEYKKWEKDASLSLSGKYTQSEIKTVIDWFRTIKGAEERDLIGDEEVAAMLKFVCAKNNFDLYNTFMARLFIYAPLILKEAAENNY